MLRLEQIRDLATQTPSKIVLLVIDGLGGLPNPDTGKTELETAHTPNLDQVASLGICGMVDPVSRGITPGSAPGHLALFGYNPIEFTVGRGILEVLGIDFDIKRGDVAARGNFCTIDNNGLVVDRRAGRISTEKNTELCSELSGITLDGAKLFVVPVKEHRLAVIFRGDELVADVSDSDPQKEGLGPQTIIPHSPQAQKVADLANEFATRAKAVLANHHPANMVLLRGFSQHPDLPTMEYVFKLNAAAIAAYPMYRGLAKLVGMRVLDTGPGISDEFDTLTQHYSDHDFFFMHIKKTDSTGEDGNFSAKVQVFEEIDEQLPRILKLEPDVLVISGDHSTPALLKSHSWHPVPITIYSKWCRHDQVREFSESACSFGALGRFPSAEVMPLAMANALKLAKFGA
ncbi:MAG: 2,3-bisphosphoglycerate-independent phosphoglycerate mutase [Dehalococcoidia bacterium]|nr:MAG: 2,3-bisphosphoglycerate-independent phosphoglycerate mutase [Dehalococcoidia bacterium]